MSDPTANRAPCALPADLAGKGYRLCPVCRRVAYRGDMPACDACRARGHHAAPDAAPTQSPAPPRACPGPRYRSKLEAAYAAYLDQQQAVGLVKWWLYERLPALPINETVDGDGNRKTRRYKTDFFVALPAPGAEHPLAIVPCVDEVKGKMHRGRERGIAKWDASAARHPYLMHRLIERDATGRWRVQVSQVGERRPQPQEQ